MMGHTLIEKSTKIQIDVATEAADWLIDAVATATQDRRFLRGEPEYDEVVSKAIIDNGIISALRAIHAIRRNDNAADRIEVLEAEVNNAEANHILLSNLVQEQAQMIERLKPVTKQWIDCTTRESE